MTYLLDTQAVLWFWWDAPDLSPAAAAAIGDPAARKWVSVASPWEVAIKVSIGKLDIGGPFPGFFSQHMRRNNFEWLHIRDLHLDFLVELPHHHKDPFDRLMIAQARAEGVRVVSADPQWDAYGVTRVW